MGHRLGFQINHILWFFQTVHALELHWERGSYGKSHFQEEVLRPQMSVPDCSDIQEQRLLPCNYCGCTVGIKSCFRNSGTKFTTPSYCLTPRGSLICCWDTPRAHSAVIGQSCWLFHVREKWRKDHTCSSFPGSLAWEFGDSIWVTKEVFYHSAKKMNEQLQTLPFYFFKDQFLFEEDN